MEIISIPTIKTYKKLILQIYKDDLLFKDNKTSLLPLTCGASSAFYQHSKQEMVGVKSSDIICCISIFIQHENDKDTMYLSFFEGLPDCEKEFRFLIDHARATALKWGCTKIIAGINGHCNYSLGFLSSGFDVSPAFGQSYNPDYYNSYFEGIGATVRRQSILKQDLETFNKNEARLKAAEKIISKQIVIRSYTLKDFKSAMTIYTALNNEIFPQHWYYYKRNPAEDEELFATMKPITDSESFLVAYKDEKPIGFLLWYPEYNELVPIGKGAGVGAFLKLKLLKQKPSSLIVTEIGVLPQHEKTGLIMALFAKLLEIKNRKYPQMKTGYSSWICQENKSSLTLSSKLFQETCKEYCVYELDV